MAGTSTLKHPDLQDGFKFPDGDSNNSALMKYNFLDEGISTELSVARILMGMPFPGDTVDKALYL